jgi:hypothetical protein
MPWFKIDDGFTNSKPVLRLQRRVRSSAIGLWTLAGAWSAKELTDGFIPEYVIEELASTPAIAAHLVKCGLWEEAPDGWKFKGWEKYQPTREQIMEAREREAERKRKYRESQRRPSGTGAGQTEGHQQESDPPDPTRPDPTPYIEEANASSRPRKRATRIAEDFQVTPEMRAWAATKAPNTDLGLETDKFINYWVAKSGKDATKLDWVATWRNWILNARSNQPTRMDHSARSVAKGAAMLAAWDAKNEQEQFLELEA